MNNSLGLGRMGDSVGFAQITADDASTSLPEDPFRMNTVSDWFCECRMDLVSDSLSASMGQISSLMMDESELSLPEDPFCMKVNDAAEPHHAFEFVLPYLDMKGTLALEGVCSSLRHSVRKEPFLWRTIDLAHSPLKYRLTDDSLFKLTHHARGHLLSLNLQGCLGITDNGLMRVLASNPRLTKLSISGCHRLSTAGVLSIFRDLKSSNRLGVKTLITGGVLYFTKEQFKELNLLLGPDATAGLKSKRRRFYTYARSDFSLEDGRVTDLELCPSCEKPSLVFDCAAETCPWKDHPCPISSCRACVVCIERCHDCGGCLNDCKDKPFCFQFSCVVCYKKRSNELLELV